MNLFNDIFLKMTWLRELSSLIVEYIFRINPSSNMGGIIEFFIYDVFKIFILLIVLIFTISYIQSYFPPERTKRILSNFKGIKGNIMASLLGSLTPFCSCSSIPIFIGFTASGLPIGLTFSFLIASPLVNPAAFVLLMTVFGFKTALAYVLLGITLAVISGIIIEKLKMEDQVMDYVKKAKPINIDSLKLTKKDRIKYSKEEAIRIFNKVWIFIIVGVLIGSFIHNIIPQSIIENILGSKNPLAVILAVIVGIPIYADIFGTIPIASALLNKGVQVGTILAFMMSVTAMSIPSLVMISKVVKPKLMILFISIVTLGIIIIGYLFNIFQLFLI